jgi:hypothetical protein
MFGQSNLQALVGFAVRGLWDPWTSFANWDDCYYYYYYYFGCGCSAQPIFLMLLNSFGYSLYMLMMKATAKRIEQLGCIRELIRAGGSYHRRFAILLFCRPLYISNSSARKRKHRKHLLMK